MKKKKLSLLIALLFVINSVLCISFAAYADDTSWSYNADTQTLTISGTGAMDDYNENTLQSIPWYSVRSEIKHIVVESGITHIGDYSFCRSASLTDVSLPDGLESIGMAAIAGCDSFKEITIPDSVVQVDDYAFGYTYDMSLTEGFMTHCSFNSAAQQYCLKSYIPFEVPLTDGKGTAVCLGSNWQSIWSFTPKADGVITWYSTGGADTYGLIYDASDYVYSSSYAEMKKSALVQDSDSGSNLNFQITYNVEAGKTYYLAAKYESAAKKEGSFEVCLDFECVNHMYKTVSFADGVAQLECSICSAQSQAVFSDYINQEFAPLDVVEDGIINIKDFAKLSREYK